MSFSSWFKKARKYILKFLYYCGFIKIVLYINKNKIAIFMIHGVAEQNHNSLWVPIRSQQSPEMLDRDIELLKKHFNFISINKAILMLNGQIKMKPNCMVLTFDDGYRNNLKYALPILKKHNIPSIFFVSTGHIEKRRPFWVDRLDYILQIEPLTKTINIGNNVIGIDRSSRKKQLESINNIIRKIEDSFSSDQEMQEAIENILNHLEENRGKQLKTIFENDDWSAILTWNEVIKAFQQGVSIGSHTIDHVRLDQVDLQESVYQLKGSKKMIKENTGIEVDVLCYPYGFYTHQAAKIAKECGYRCGLTTVEGLNGKNADIMELKRLSFPTNKDPFEVMYVASGISVLVEKVKGKIFKLFKK